MSEIRKQRRPLGRTDWILVVLAVAVVGGSAVLWLRHRPGTPFAEAPEITATAAPVAAQTPASPEASAAPSGSAPSVGADRVRSLLEPVSANALFRGWLTEADPVRRWTIVTDNLAEGVTPRKQLGFLAPSGPFAVVDVNSKSAISPESYRRYDDFADAVASIDAQALAKVYRELHPVLEAAYRALGYPGASLDRVTARALHRIEAAPVQEGDVLVERQDKVYVFTDPRLENLGGVDKHLLRMGPRNTRLLQAKAREIREALGLPAAVAARDKR